MSPLKGILETWEPSLRKEVDLGELFSRNNIAHKWKATYRITVLRELVFWRMTDLLKQIIVLGDQQLLLGARILLRSMLETIAVLVYLNIKMKAVRERSLNFDEFQKMTTALMLGSRNDTTGFQSINIVTIITKHCERKYKGIAAIYEDLSESAHPNYEGICGGYSYIDEKEYITYFKNRWEEKYSSSFVNMALVVLGIFENEYNIHFIEEFEKLEAWLVENDEQLEKYK